MKKILAGILLIGCAFIIPNLNQAQTKNIGLPAIQNFDRETYHAGTQNWDIIQNQDGFMYFANNNGVLEFDGSNWNLYPLSEISLTRALSIGDDGTIYVGLYNDFGCLEHAENGKLFFKSFREALPDSMRDFDDVWKIHSTPNGIFFQTYRYLFRFDRSGKLIETHKCENRFRFSFLVNNRLLIQEEGDGLKEWNEGSLKIIPEVESIKYQEIWVILPGEKNSLILGTSDGGVYSITNGKLIPWNNEANYFLKKNKILSGCRLKNGNLVFGTIQNGIIITSEEGMIRQHLNKEKGLQNNTVLSVADDHEGNLWIGLDNGIDYAEINSPVTFLNYPYGLGAGYAASINQDKLYLGTNNGLFVKNWRNSNTLNQNEFRLISNTVGQVWYLGIHQGILLCGHHNGTFQIRDESARKISDIPGSWKFLELKKYPGFLIGGNYQGLTLYKKDNVSATWKFVKRIAGFSESSRVMEEDSQGNIWMSHGFKGVFRLTLSDDLDSVSQVRYYNSKDGFPSDYNINVYKINNEPVFATGKGTYRYDEGTDRFIRYTELEKMFFGIEEIVYLKQDEHRNIWLVGSGSPSVLRYLENGTYVLVSEPFRIMNNHMVGGFEFIYPYSDEHVFFGMEKGFAHYTPQSETFKDLPFKAFINKIEIPNLDTVIYGGENLAVRNFKGRNEVPVFHFKKNRFRFIYTTPVYASNRGVEYSYYLENYNEDWTTWSEKRSCEFTNLREGTYTFSVKARDAFGKLSDQDQFFFRILPPWYRSKVAYFAYFILVLLFILFLIWFFLKRIEISKQKERLKQQNEYRAREEQYQRDAWIAEKEIIKLRNDKLRATMIHRDKELANQTFHLIEKNKFLTDIKEEFQKISKQIKESEIRSKLNTIILRIDKDINNEKQWEIFESVFDEVHEDFLKRLKEKFPKLTPSEMRLCAYLRMNISSKEIAPLMNISVRGVEIGRYRLRKKLNIGHDTNLTKFILEL